MWRAGKRFPNRVSNWDHPESKSGTNTPQTTLAVEVNYIAIYGPGLRAKYPKGTSITPTWETVVTHKLAVKAPAGADKFTLDEVTEFNADQIVEINDPHREEYLTVESITGKEVTVRLPLLHDHDMGTQVSAVESAPEVIDKLAEKASAGAYEFALNDATG